MNPLERPAVAVALLAWLSMMPAMAKGQEVDLQIETRGVAASQKYLASKKNELNQRMERRQCMKHNTRFTGELSTSDHFEVSGKNNENRAFVTSNKKTLQEALEKNKTQIEELRADIESSSGWMMPEIEVGELQIPTFGRLGSAVNVRQITDGNKFIGEIGRTSLIFEGFDTTKFADGTSVSINQPVKVVETETYTTVIGGTKTLFKVVPLSEEESTEVIKSQTKEREPFKGETFRTWTDSSKKFSVKAWFLERDKSEVVLKKENGEKLRIPLSKLCAEDKSWIRAWEL